MTSGKSILQNLTVGLILTLLPLASRADPVRVRHVEGELHGFVVLRSETGKIVGAGDIAQTVQGDQVKVSLKLNFRDGSAHEETSVFTQRGSFRLLSDHLRQSGPAFKDPLEMWIDCRSGQVRVLDLKNGKNDITQNRLDIPRDLANGITPILVKNFSGPGPYSVTMLVATPKPRIVKLVIGAQSDESFDVDGQRYNAQHYVAKFDLKGIVGKVAPLVGKQPPDLHLWILKGDAPVFLKSEGQLAPESPVWQVQVTSPTWQTTGDKNDK